MSSRLHLIIYLLAAALLSPLTANAQENSMRTTYDEAEEEYRIGRIEQALTLLDTNMGKFNANLKKSAYRLKALCNIALDRPEEAEECVTRLLELDPYFTTSSQDPQRFADMIASAKAGLRATITTASSHAEDLAEVPVPTTLITEEMIRISGARNLQEVLAAYVPSMTIVDCNDDINIAMRGIYSNGQEKILIMLNGHRLNSYCTNIASVDFSMSLEKIKQIEVLRGPASSLYGGVSLTAVVNLITKQGADVDGVKLRIGAGNYGQMRGDAIFGKRYFDLDILAWGSIYRAKGESVFVPVEDTGLRLNEGDVTIGGIGSKPTYDAGIELKYKNLELFYNSHFSQIQSPMTMTYTFSPYQVDKYRTFNGIGPSFMTNSHHAHISYSDNIGKVYLKGTASYDNSDLAHYQVITEETISALTDILPLPSVIIEQVKGHGGIYRYINGQEYTLGAKLQGDWTYLNTDRHNGQLTFGAEAARFKLSDARYTFGYDFNKTLPESYDISEKGKGVETNYNGFLQVKHRWGPVIANFGLRFDYKDRYNGTNIREVSPRLALIYLQPKWNVKLSYAKAFIDAPYLYRKTNLLLSHMMGSNLVEDLDPETLHAFQLTLGATQWAKGLNMELNAFYNKGENLIYMSLFEHYNSTNPIRNYGLEFVGSYQRNRFNAYLSTVWQKSHTVAYQIDNNYNRAINTPAVTVNAVAGWRVAKDLLLHGHIAFDSPQTAEYIDIYTYAAVQSFATTLAKLIKQYEESPTAQLKLELTSLTDTINEFSNSLTITKDVPARVIFDIGANYTIGNLELSLDVKNLLNTRYYQSGVSTGLIPQKGRWFIGTVAYKF